MNLFRAYRYLKFMDAVPPHQTNQDVQPKVGDDTGSVKRPLMADEAVLPDSKRAKVGTEGTLDTGSDKGPDLHSFSGTPETARKPQKGKKSDKNKGRRRGTRLQAEDDPDHPRTPRLPKKQCAILLGFFGTNYAGMQMYAPASPSLPESSVFTPGQPAQRQDY